MLLLWTGGRRYFSHSRRAYSSVEPLKIAFFGTDVFATFSLHALRRYQQTQLENRIQQLDLITRSPKHAGRGRKLLNEPATMKYARDNGIEFYTAETAEEINALANQGYNMAIAVSYGKLIPGKFLNALKYGGLNVHPSLLPQLAGAAPIQHAIFKGLDKTGVTVQTLHPEEFDKGTIIHQEEGVKIESTDNVKSLAAKLAKKSANSLVHVIDQQLYDKQISLTPAYPPSPAPKLALKDKEIDLQKDGVQEVISKYKVFDQVHSFQHGYLRRTRAQRKGKETKTRRVIMGSLSDVSEQYKVYVDMMQVGEYVILSDQDLCVIKLRDGAVAAKTMLLEGFGFQTPNRFAKAMWWRGLVDSQLRNNPE